MIVIGADAHKRTHTWSAVDQVGRKLGERTVKATSDGHLRAVGGAAVAERRWAVEDCRHLTRRLEADLLRAGQRVVRVPTRLMATARRAGRQPASPTRSTRWRSPRPRCASQTCPSPTSTARPGKVKLLADYRADLVVERTRLCNRLRWHLHELDPELEVPSRGLRRYKVIDELAVQLAGVDGTVARLARELLARCRELTVRDQPAGA